MNTRHAQQVLTILECGSISAAAKKLYITQPTLSATLKQIETQFGEPIFDRSTSPLTLTAAGELFVHAARRMLLIETQLDEAISALHGEQKGTLRLGMQSGRSCELLPQILPDYSSAYPNIRISVMEADPKVLEQKLLDREIDMALFLPDSEHPELTYRLIASEQFVLLANKRTAIAQRIPSGSTITLKEAEKERFILPGSHVCDRRMLNELLQSHGLRNIKPALEFDNMETAKRTCAACPAVMLSPYISLLSDAPLMQKLSYYLLSSETAFPRFCLAHPAEESLPPYAEAFFNLASNRYRAMCAYRP